MRTLLLFLSLVSSVFAIDWPQGKFRVTEDVISIGTDFTLKSTSATLGTVEQRVMSWGTTFTLKDAKGVVVATAKKSLFSWGTEIKIFDAADKHIGTIEKQIIESMFTLAGSVFTVKNAAGTVLAKSEKLKVWASYIEIKEGKRQVAVFDEDNFNVLSAGWDATITGIDPRLVIFIPCFQTHKDNTK